VHPVHPLATPMPDGTRILYFVTSPAGVESEYYVYSTGAPHWYVDAR